jgi:hypothetical protein
MISPEEPRIIEQLSTKVQPHAEAAPEAPFPAVFTSEAVAAGSIAYYVEKAKHEKVPKNDIERAHKHVA